MLRIRKPRGFTGGQLILVTILGVFGGVYIWKPVFTEYPKNPGKVEATDTKFVFMWYVTICIQHLKDMGFTLVFTRFRDGADSLLEKVSPYEKMVTFRKRITAFMDVISSSPIGMVSIVLIGTTATLIAYKTLVAPHLRRTSRGQQEAYADFLFEKELLSDKREESDTLN